MIKLKCWLRNVLLIAIGLFWIPVVWADLNDGLVAYYPFNGNANDKSGNGNHGTVYGAILTKDRNGNAGNAYSFDGVNDYIHLSSLDSIGFKNGTVTLWFKLATGFHTGDKAMNLFSKDNQPYEQNVIEAYFDGNTGKIKLDYGDFEQSIFSDSNSWDYQWYHFAFKWGSIGLKMYVNGIKQTDTLDIVSPVNADTITHIGTHQAVANFFKGDIDDIRIYNRALSKSEIQQLYQTNNQPVKSPSNDCWATYENGKLHIPCFKLKGELGEELHYELDMQYKPLSKPISFQLTGAKHK